MIGGDLIGSHNDQNPFFINYSPQQASVNVLTEERLEYFWSPVPSPR